MQKLLLVLNDAPYGSERIYNGLRMALALSKVGVEMKVFLFGDAVLAAKANQKLPSGHFNLGIILRNLVRAGAEVGL